MAPDDGHFLRYPGRSKKSLQSSSRKQIPESPDSSTEPAADDECRSTLRPAPSRTKKGLCRALPSSVSTPERPSAPDKSTSRTSGSNPAIAEAHSSDHAARERRGAEISWESSSPSARALYNARTVVPG